MRSRRLWSICWQSDDGAAVQSILDVAAAWRAGVTVPLDQVSEDFLYDADTGLPV